MNVAAPKPPRIVYFDALRAFCMFYGILVHGATLDHDGDVFLTVIRVFSDLFRMATFFLIAGYFTAMVASKNSGADYFRGRAILILVPLVTTLVLLVPITNYLIHVWHTGPMPMRTYFLEGGWALPSLGKDVWHLHLWFLFSLFFYAMVTPALLALVRRPAVNGAIDRYVALTGGWTLWANVAVIAIAVLAMRVVYSLVLARFVGGTRADFIVTATLGYFPYYALGLVMFVNAGLFRSMHRINWIGLGAAAALFLTMRYGGLGLPLTLDRFLIWSAKAATVVFIIAALLRIFEIWFKAPSKALSFCIDGAFTFYLFHMTGIYLVANLLGPVLDRNVLLIFWIVVVSVPPAVLAIHAWVIVPSPTLRLLFNGRVPKR